ncbi:integrin alpha-8-like isoform X1 [Patiria miniata]|uniref:Integrin alpha-2 domain-containing protein n=2 Tax=Patiria miniata TaxID=46514 RepID=A0A913YZ36_PATMI|nr:integrin alpha-8-like isoform X1 [Patiria miniata]
MGSLARCLPQLAAVLALAWGQNLDTQWPVKHSGPAGSMFGYSVALHREGSTNWLLVGAPKAQTPQPDVVQGGAVYKCPVAPLNSPGDCEQIPFDLTGHTVDARGDQVADKSHQWFGASLKSAGPDGRVVACAPRYTWFFTAEMKDEEREPVGHCYVSENNFSEFDEYAPCRTTDIKIWGCQAGFSAEITKDSNLLVMGAAGSFYLQGQIYVQNLVSNAAPLATPELPPTFDDSYSGFDVALGDFTGDSQPEYVVGAPRGNYLAGKVTIFDTELNELMELRGEQTFSYFGHTVVAEDLNGDGLDDVIVGAPLYSDRRTTVEKWEAGKVYIYYQNADHSFSEPSTITGEMIRSRLGSSIASLGDVNQDGYNDIAIGAPYQGEDQAGVVYIYYGTPNGLRLRSSQVLTPADFNLKNVTTFGFSLTGGLDMDENNYPDLLIGAENSDLAVLVRARPVISIAAVLSISPEGINLDNKSLILQDGTPVTSFEITSCFTYKGKHLPDTALIQYTLSLDTLQMVSPRALFAAGSAPGTNQDKTKMELTKESEYCRVSMAYVKPSIRDKLRPISVNLEYGLNTEDAVYQDYELQPFLSSESSSVTMKQVYINNNCADNVCIPDLEVKATTSTSELVIGSGDSILLNTIVLNKGEDAFLATLRVVVPTGVQFVRVERKQEDYSLTCSDDTEVNTIICDIGNPLRGRNQVDFGLKFSSFQLSGDKSSVAFAMSAMSENVEASTDKLVDNLVNITVGVRAEVDLVLLGRSIPAQVAYSPEGIDNPEIIKESEAGPQVVHVYEVSNAGPSDAGLITFDVSWPMLDADRNFLLYLIKVEPSSGSQCRVSGEVNPLNLTLEENNQANNVSGPNNASVEVQRQRRQADQPEQQVHTADCSTSNCLTISCTIQHLKGGQSEVIRFLARLWNNTLVETTFDRLVISSRGVAKVINLPYTIDPPELPQVMMEVSTIASPDEPVVKRVPIWIIIVAVIGGLLLLLIVILVLWKCGFFKRKKYSPIASDEKRADL